MSGVLQIPSNYKRKSDPIPIKYVKEDSSIEYNLKLNFFNPNKFSPPNPWHERLLQRLDSFYDLPSKMENLDKK